MLINRAIPLVVFSIPALAAAQAVPVAPPTAPARNAFPTAKAVRGEVNATSARRAARLKATLGGAAKPAGSSATGYSGGDYVHQEGGNPALYGSGDKVRYRRQVPEYHLVRDGDTLWGVCEYYYGDPWMWPKLWAKNRSVTNPHWIYPGDKIRMIGGRPGVRTADDGPDPLASGRRLAAGPVVLRQRGFVDQGEVQQAGTIVGSKRESLMLTTFQEVYVKGGEKFTPRVGKAYTIYKVRRELRDGERVHGQIVEILGSLKVKRINKHGVATAEIIEAVGVIERGHLVGPLRRSYVRLAVRPAKRNLDARMFDTYRGMFKHFGTDELVFIDRGRKHGVHLGNRFLVLRRGDGYRKVLVDPEKDNAEFPHEVIAEITVLDLRDEVSVGLVTRGIKELRVGEHVRLRRGY